MSNAIFMLMLCLPFISDSRTTATSEANGYEKKLDAGMEAFYQTDWDHANIIFNDLKRHEPLDPMPYFFESMMPF